MTSVPPLKSIRASAVPEHRDVPLRAVKPAPDAPQIDALEKSENRLPTSLADLLKVAPRVTQVAGPDTGFADMTVAVPDMPFHGSNWSDVPAWTTFSVSRAFLGHASPVLRRTLEDRTERGCDAFLLMEWTPCVSAQPAQQLLDALYGAPLVPDWDNVVELRAILQYWHSPAQPPLEESDFLPVWSSLQQRCSSVVQRFLKPNVVAVLYDRARACGDVETERDVAAWAAESQAARPWLLSLDEGSLHQIIGHPAFAMTSVDRIKLLLQWVGSEANLRMPGAASSELADELWRTREHLRQAMSWHTLDDDSTRALGLPSLVSAVAFGLLDPGEGFRLLHRLGAAALPTPPVATQTRAAAPPVAGSLAQRAAAARLAPGRIPSTVSNALRVTGRVSELAGWWAFDVALGALAGTSATYGVVVAQDAFACAWPSPMPWLQTRTAFRGAWLGACAGAVVGFVELVAIWGCSLARMAEMRRKTALLAAFTAAPGIGTLAGAVSFHALVAWCAWPFEGESSLGELRGTIAVIGCFIGALFGFGAKVGLWVGTAEA